MLSKVKDGVAAGEVLGTTGGAEDGGAWRSEASVSGLAAFKQPAAKLVRDTAANYSTAAAADQQNATAKPYTISTDGKRS